MKDLVSCPKCGRRNWRENTRCNWCLRKMPRYEKLVKRFDIMVIIVSVIAISTVLNWLIR